MHPFNRKYKEPLKQLDMVFVTRMSIDAPTADWTPWPSALMTLHQQASVGPDGFSPPRMR